MEKKRHPGTKRDRQKEIDREKERIIEVTETRWRSEYILSGSPLCI